MAFRCVDWAVAVSWKLSRLGCLESEEMELWEWLRIGSARPQPLYQ